MRISPSSILSDRSFESAAARRLLIGWLPILGVALLLFWLSGGIPPTSWIILIQLFSQWGALQTLLGGGVLIPLFIILLQSLLILAAWILLGLTIRHEIGVISTMRAQQRMLQHQSAQLAALPETSPSSGSQGVRVLDEKPEAQPAKPGATASAKNTGLQIVANDDDFDPSMAVFELTSDPEPESESPEKLKKLKKEEETIFIYGNPFDGELPEVFHYDMDLKRDIATMQEELRNQKQASQKLEAGVSEQQEEDTIPEKQAEQKSTNNSADKPEQKSTGNSADKPEQKSADNSADKPEQGLQINSDAEE